MNTNEKREQKTPMKFVELVKTKTEIMARRPIVTPWYSYV